MDNRSLINLMEAEEAYKKFLKSSKGILGFNFRKKENLKSFSEIQREENAYNSVNLGLKEVPLGKIVGSVEKYKDFDKNFVPKNNIVKQRWINIYIGYTEESMMMPVILYKIKDSYYVYDGNHRVSVAKFLNFAMIEAQVEEFLPATDTKDDIIYREHMIFEKETGLADIILSEPINYKYLREEIESYKNLLDIRKNRSLDLKEAARKWNIDIFLPVKTLLEKNEIIKNYEGDSDNVFLFFLEHKYYLSKNAGRNIGYLYSAVDFINLVKTNENKNLEDMCQIQTEEMAEKARKLEKIDNELINPDFEQEKKIREMLEEQLISCFAEGLEKLPGRYSEYLFKSGQNSRKTVWRNFAGWIIDYMQILNIQKSKKSDSRNEIFDKKDENIDNFDKKEEFENIRIDTLNYILEIFLPITEIFLKIDEELVFSFDNYRKLQNEFFILLNLKDNLDAEAKIGKYEYIMRENIRIAVETKNLNVLFGVEKLLVQEKKKEFLKNLKNPEKFKKILKKYGETEKYETYVKFFIELDNLGEEKFIGSLEKDLKEFYIRDENVNEYKTKKVLNVGNNEVWKSNYEMGFIDFFVNHKKFKEKIY